MLDIAPDIFRQRLLIEGYFAIEVDEKVIEEYLLELAARLGLRTYGRPMVYSPGGRGKDVNQGFDAFVPLIDSGIAAYFWTAAKFMSVVIYSCKQFDPEAAIGFTRHFLEVQGEMVQLSF